MVTGVHLGTYLGNRCHGIVAVIALHILQQAHSVWRHDAVRAVGNSHARAAAVVCGVSADPTERALDGRRVVDDRVLSALRCRVPCVEHDSKTNRTELNAVVQNARKWCFVLFCVGCLV